jgi:hypothetical protein
MDRCYVFIDESGDFGCSKKSSRYVILVALFSEDSRRLQLIPRRIRRSDLGKRALRRNVGLDFHSTSDSIRRHLLEEVIKSGDVRIGSIVVRKSKSEFNECHGNSLYLDMSRRLVTEIIEFERARHRLEVTFDRIPFHYGHKHFFEDQISRTIFEKYRQLRSIPPEIVIRIRSSEASPGLIATDFIAGAIQKKYSFGDLTFYEIIKDAVCFERENKT